MFDFELRKVKDVILKPIAIRVSEKVSPLQVTVASFIVGLICLILVLQGFFVIAFILWILNRILDGLDGLIARLADKKSDLGGFLDLFFDFIIYSGIPLAFSFHFNTIGHFASSAVLLSTFYINSAVWMIVSAILEKNKIQIGQQTSIKMPRGLVEGFETIIFYSLMFILPDKFILLSYLMAALVTAGIIVRFIQAVKMLNTRSTV